MLLLVLLQAGCLSRKVKIPASQQLLPAQTVTRSELVRRLEERGSAIQTLAASAQFLASGGGIDTGEIRQWRETTGTILLERPAQIRVIVKFPVIGTTVADMVSDGRQFHLSLPLKSEWASGDSNAPGSDPNPLKNLRPKHVLDALFVDVRPYLSDPGLVMLLKEAVQGRHSYYILEFVNTRSDTARIVEELWVDRTDLEVAWKIIYGNDGKVESKIEFLNYQNNGGIMFPQVINLERPAEHYSLKMTFEKTTFNGTLPDRAFVLERPSGAREIELAPSPVYHKP